MADTPTTGTISMSQIRSAFRGGVALEGPISLGEMYSSSNGIVNRVGGVAASGQLSVTAFYNKTIPYMPVATGSTPIAMWSTRRLSSTYTGFIMKVRRGSDNVEKDFYADKLGNVRDGAGGTSGTTLTSWLNGATGYVTTLYDQSGSNYHCTQGVTTSQPVIELVDNTKMKINFNGTYMIGNSSLNTNSVLPIKSYYVFEYDLPSGAATLFHRGSASECRYEPAVDSSSAKVSGCTGRGQFATYTTSSTRTNILMVQPDAGNTLTRTCEMNGTTVTTTSDRTIGAATSHATVAVGAGYSLSTTTYGTNGVDFYIRSILMYNSTATITDVLSFLNQLNG